MKIRRSILFLLGCGLVLLGTSANASATNVNVQLTGVNGVSQDGVYVDPYYGSTNSNPTILVCDDFTHNTTIGESWTATVSTFSNLSAVRFQQNSQAQTLQDYEEAAYLYTQLLANPSQYSDISFALWSIFTPSVENLSGFTGNAQTWLNQAQSQNFYTGEFSNFEILTPSDGGPGSPQEFLSETSEPADALLVLSGLSLLSLLWRRRVFA